MWGLNYIFNPCDILIWDKEVQFQQHVSVFLQDIVGQCRECPVVLKHCFFVNWWKFYLFLTEISILDSKQLELFSNLIVYLLINYFGVAWMAVREVFISRKSCKTLNNPAKSPKIDAFLHILHSCLVGAGLMFDTPALHYRN